jgi:hypothetical protein
MIWDLVYLDRVVHIPFSFFFFLRMHSPRFEHHLLHIHTCQGLEQTTEPVSLGLCWEPQHEIWMVVDLKSEVSRMNSNHVKNIVDAMANRVGSQLAR